MAKPKTRSKAKDFDTDKDFPPSKYLQPPTKLPTLQSVIGMIRYHLEPGNGKVTTDMAVREVAKQIYALPQRERDQQFQYKTLDNITDILIETGEIPSSSSSDEEQEGRPQKRQKTSETDT
ncbi:hypothetical protein AAFF_G00009680 [Aldrovandia affinis]|uniref:Uncharacterized protein n=1 Tax=Aldrovandia affinis TaxID=143900 RepID=A0AAD7S701_9TELE|nr:hypothetical protein AAFF_G00009680 [Aldrovandia affinis]